MYPFRKQSLRFLQLSPAFAAESTSGPIYEIGQHSHSGSWPFRRDLPGGQCSGDRCCAFGEQTLGRVCRVCLDLCDPPPRFLLSHTVSPCWMLVLIDAPLIAAGETELEKCHLWFATAKGPFQFVIGQHLRFRCIVIFVQPFCVSNAVLAIPLQQFR